jgi:hypothetical protein
MRMFPHDRAFANPCLVRTARVMVFIGHMADLARAVACRKAGALVIEAAARIDALDAANRARRV